MILVALNWPNQPWCPDLREMLVAPPWRAPLRRDLLSQANGAIWHSSLELWSLQATSGVLGGLSYSTGLDNGSLPSKLKVYVAAIASFHSPVDGQSIRRHALVVRFLRGARRFLMPPWDLVLVLKALSLPPFEP